MQVRLLAEITDTRRTYEIGEVADMLEDQAHRWISAGWAEVVVPAETVVAPEAAAVAPAPETATRPRGEKR